VGVIWWGPDVCNPSITSSRAQQLLVKDFFAPRLRPRPISTILLDMKKPQKGDIVATTIHGNIIQVWFQSPTGDSSDVQIFNLECVSYNQAVAIANNINATNGIEVLHLDCLNDELVYSEDLETSVI